MDYMPGVTYKDVLAGRPVTAEEVFKGMAKGGMAVTVKCGKCDRMFTMKNPNNINEPCRHCGGIIRPMKQEGNK